MILDEKDALKAGHNKLFFTWNGIGANLALMTAAREYHSHTGKKILIGTSHSWLFENTDFADVIVSLNFDFFNGTNGTKNLEQIQKKGISPFFITSNSYKWLAPKYESNICQFSKKHIIAAYCDKLGVSGKINVVPQLVLTSQEKEFGKFFPKDQICVISDGLQKYKSWPHDKMAAFLEKTRQQYNFVQVGKETDALLPHVLDLRGKLSFRQLAGVLYNSRLFVGPTGGMVHLARAVNCPSVVLATKGEPAELTYYAGNGYVFAREACDLCARNVRDPQHQACYFGYTCVQNIDVADVLDAVQEQFQKSVSLPEVQWEKSGGVPVDTLEDFYAQKHTKSDFCGVIK